MIYLKKIDKDLNACAGLAYPTEAPMEIIRIIEGLKMKKKQLSTLLSCLIAGLILFTNCSDEPTMNIIDGGVIMPLAFGNYWKYKIYYYSSSNPTGIMGLDSFKTEIKGKILLEGEEWFYTDDESTAMRNEINGLWTINRIPNEEFKIEHARLILKYPTYVGDKWDITNTTAIGTTVGINIATTVPAGTFNCIKYQYSVLGGSFETVQYAPNIGRIKSISRRGMINYYTVPPDTTFTVNELLEYNIIN